MIRYPAGRVPPILLAMPLLALTLAGCRKAEVPVANQTGPVKVEGAPIRSSASGALPGTPMAERSAVIGLLNKRNGLTRDLTIKPGEAVRVGDAIVRLAACETSAPWENVQETGAFIQLDVRSSADNKWRRAFSGWLFRERPDRNVVQHPIYDVWVRSCAMEWPESGPDTVKLGGKSESGEPSANGRKARSAATPEPVESTPSQAPSVTPSTATPNN